MDPQLKSILSSVGMVIATSVAGYAVHAGIIPSSDQSVLANQLALAGAGLIAAGLAWYKARQVSKAAVIQQVNAQDNGVKVVPASAPVQPVNAPLK